MNILVGHHRESLFGVLSLENPRNLFPHATKYSNRSIPNLRSSKGITSLPSGHLHYRPNHTLRHTLKDFSLLPPQLLAANLNYTDLHESKALLKCHLGFGISQ